MDQFEVIRLFRQAQSRANNVARDLDDLDWQPYGGQMGYKNLEEQLKEIHEEARLIVECLGKLVTGIDPK